MDEEAPFLVEEVGLGPILDPQDPLASARVYIRDHHAHHAGRTLHHFNGDFYVWRGTHYAVLSPEAMLSSAWKFLGGAHAINEDGVDEAFKPSRHRVANFVEALGAETQLDTLRLPAWLDAGNRPPADEIVAFDNTLLHLRTGSRLAHTPAYMSTNALGFAYDPYAGEPAEWLGFLQALWPDDPEQIDTLQEVFGLLLTADTRYQKAFLLVGPKRSGKGTIARVLAELLGPSNVCAPTLSGLATNFGVAPLIGKRAAIISDARLGGKADQAVIAERLLSITGEDNITVDRKYRDPWTGKIDARFLVLTNELPRLKDASGALASRFLILRMTESFYGREDLGLTARLTRELPGILLWAIAGWHRLSERGHFVPPSSSQEAVQELEDLGSPIGAFLRDRCTIDPGRSCLSDDAFAAYVDWCRQQGRDHTGDKSVFGRDLAAAIPGLKVVQVRINDGSRARFYSGLSLI